MSKQGKRKITVELPKTKDLTNRPSVFERLGIKKASSAKKTSEHCRQWAQHGSCAYGKSCKFAATHTLISPSKQRAANKDSEQKRNLKDDAKNRLHSTVVVRRTPDGEIDNWDQNDLEYADTDVLEKRRLQLQRELELQLKMETGKDMRKDKKKPVSSSSSSRSSSSSSASSSSSGTSSSSSSGRDARRKGKKGKLKRNSSSSSDGDALSKKKVFKNDTSKREKNDSKKTSTKKDDKQVKKPEVNKKKGPNKTTIGKKSLSPGKKSGGTPPITSKVMPKVSSKHGKSPPRKDRNKSVSKDREKDRDRKEREKEKDRRARSRSPKKGRSRSPRRQQSTSKDNRKKDSSERSRPVSPKKPIRRDGSVERHRKKSPSRDRARDNKDKTSSSLEKRKDKHDDKDRHDRKDRGRDRNKDNKRDDSKRRGRDRGLGARAGANKGLEKPSKPMERLLPRPEERLAALAAITNKTLDTDKISTPSKDRQDTHSERGSRKQDRERDRSCKRERVDSLDREQGDYVMDRPYEHERDREYNRVEERDRYEGPRDDVRDQSPEYPVQGRDRHYDPGYDMPRPVREREYPEGDERYRDPMTEHREMGYDDRRPPHRDRSWEGRSGSMDRERGFPHPHKEWDNEDYRGGGGGGDWNRERHWPMHDPQVPEWGDKEGMEGWHHRGRPGPHRGRMHDNYNRGMRMDDRRRTPRVEPELVKEAPIAAAPPPRVEPRPEQRPERPEQRPERPEQRPERPEQRPERPEPRPEPEDEKPVPDDLSEISDDPDDILNQDDMLDQNIDEESQPNVEESSSKIECSEKESTQDTSGAGEEKEPQESKEDDDGLDFEEISDGELEEERTRAGLGDALGVDWASLVADVHRREQTAPVGGARDRWRPERVLARLGLSVHMAGKQTVQQVLLKNAESQKEIQSTAMDSTTEAVKVNGIHKDTEETKEKAVNVDALHPIAAIQVATEKRKKQRAILFGSGCEITRGLSARRDLALRRYLCHLPEAERTGQTRVAPQPSLFQAARALLQAPVNG